MGVETEVTQEVKHWKFNGSYGEVERITRVGKVEFCSLPYQSFFARVGMKTARVASILVRGKETETGGFEVDKVWSVTISNCDEFGNSVPEEQKKFPEEEKDAAFVWAAERLNVK